MRSQCLLVGRIGGAGSRWWQNGK